MSYQSQNKRLTIILICGVIFMFGFCYLLVPFYEFVCKKEGINGKGARSAATISPDMKVDY